MLDATRMALPRSLESRGFTPKSKTMSATTLCMRDRELSFKGLDLLLNRSLPNFYFHATTAYDILRHNGVEIGKRDFMGAS